MVAVNTWNSRFQGAISHRTKRKIIELLMEADLSFTEILNMPGQLNHGKFGYHLRALRGFVEFEPSTKKYRLTDEGRMLACLIRDFRSAASMNEEYARAKILSVLSDGKPLTVKDIRGAGIESALLNT